MGTLWPNINGDKGGSSGANGVQVDLKVVASLCRRFPWAT